MKYSNIILHVPHSSLLFPDDVFRDKSGKELLRSESKDLIDYHTMELFFLYKGRRDSRISVFFSVFCRTLCDVERLKDDPLEARNMGILYGGHELRCSKYGLKETADAEFLQYYEKYHEAAGKYIAGKRNPLLIDCHSFSSHSTKLVEMTPEMAEIDICLGFNEDETRPSDDFLSRVEKHFTDNGYIVALNRPFSNSKTFDTGGHQYHSLMIEVNKRVYMNEETLEKTDGFEKLQACLISLYNTILASYEGLTIREFMKRHPDLYPDPDTISPTARQQSEITYRFVSPQEKKSPTEP